MIDCLQISQMLKLSTKNSLLVIDEFGKGNFFLRFVIQFHVKLLFLLNFLNYKRWSGVDGVVDKPLFENGRKVPKSSHFPLISFKYSQEI